MSGITKLTIQLIVLISLLLVTMQFSSVRAVEKTVKVRTGQSASQLAKTAESELVTSDTVKSRINDQRQSSYQDISDPALILQRQKQIKGIDRNAVQKKYRDADVKSQLKSSGFYFNSVYVNMLTDLDYDGYYSEFRINFDADTDYNSATVYALFYLSYEGGPWELYYSSDNFDLYGWSSTDDFTVTTLLTSGYPSGSYDILIDLYDNYDNSLVATISPSDTYELAYHYLEDTSYDDNLADYSEYSIYDASITLLNDDDNDGYYHSFSLQFDADVDSGEALVYAEIWVKDSYGNWFLDHTTSDFLIDGYSTLDTYILETVWESGYSTGYYDFRIELYDAYSLSLLITSSDLSYQLSDVPLEDSTYDVQSGSGNSGGGHSGGRLQTSISQESGGGSMGLLLLVFVLLLRKSDRQI